MKTLVIVPTYNEKKNIEELIPLTFEALPQTGILVVDDNSPDGTAEAVLDLKKRFPNLDILRRQGKEGLGKAYIHAFEHALKDQSIEVIVMMDADLSHDPKYLPQMLEVLESADIVTGSRYAKGGGTIGWELWRRILSKGGNTYCRMVTGLPVYDCTAGFNAMRASVLRTTGFQLLGFSGYAFIMGLKYGFHKKGARFAEIPIIFKNRKEGESKISNHIIREGILAPWKMVLGK